MNMDNILQNVGQFAGDAAVDTTADGAINQVEDSVLSHIPIPGGATVDKMITTETDQVVNNEINAELNKGVGGILGDVEGLFGQHKA